MVKGHSHVITIVIIMTATVKSRQIYSVHRTKWETRLKQPVVTLKIIINHNPEDPYPLKKKGVLCSNPTKT